MKDTLTILREARGRISDPALWYRRHGYGQGAGPNVPACALGTVHIVMSGTPYPSDYFEQECSHPAFAALRAAAPYGLVARLNDDGSHADVLALFDRAIAAEEAKRSTVIPQAAPRRRDNAGCAHELMVA